jgi:hypothetical protein
MKQMNGFKYFVSVFLSFLIVITDPYQGINYNEVNVYEVNYCAGEYCPDKGSPYAFSDWEIEEEFEEEERELEDANSTTIKSFNFIDFPLRP